MNALIPRLRSAMELVATSALMLAACASAQVITIDTHGNPKSGEGANVDRKFAQIEPTKVQLTDSILDAKTRLELERVLESEQGFAMRPFPRGHKGLTLEANGKLEPAGEPYLNLVTSQGLSAKPGDRLVITDLKFEKDKIIFMINGGPDAKHRFLRHVHIGTGGMDSPVVQDDGQQPTGARLTLTFKDRVPELTGTQVKALLAPLISFDLKTPIQAFVDTLPPQLKAAILDHKVLVGMSTEMVLYAVGAPQSKTRETENDMPFEEWIYGQPPKPVQFVRVNGNRVVRVEVAKVGEAPQVFTENVVEAMMRSAPAAGEVASDAKVRTVGLGDTKHDPDREGQMAPPTLHKEGDSPDPMTQGQNTAMKPVQFPKQTADDHPDASKLPRVHSSDDTENPLADKPETEKSEADETQVDKPAAKARPADKAKPADKDKPAPNGDAAPSAVGAKGSGALR